ncbi:MAG: hypothetical protein K2H87_05670, partial [Duncaniella sp.]|nr:hypothetical protein [Duncaniella sp.]
SAEELIGCGVAPDSLEVSEPFVEDNEFEKPFKLWDSPIYLRDFFARHRRFFQQEYWDGITEDEFVHDVLHSINNIKKELIKLLNNNELHSIVQPLDREEEDLRLHKSIRVKIKQGRIRGRFAFRFYAIEIEEGKCYLITGAAIKIHKDMGKAPNTKIEMKKLEFALSELEANEVDTKELFIDFLF